VRLVLDTNVVVAGVVAEGLCREILEDRLPDSTPVLSTPMWDELERVLRHKFALVVDDLPILALYRRHAAWVEPEPLATAVCRDADDDWILATAKHGRADLIVTGDRDLLDLGAFEAIPIVDPRGFLERNLTA
jgi:putative PIN family toxin of toxin-antitoxin system